MNASEHRELELLRKVSNQAHKASAKELRQDYIHWSKSEQPSLTPKGRERFWELGKKSCEDNVRRAVQ